MNKVIRCKNNNNRKVFGLLLAQVFLGVCPVLLLVFFVLFEMYETKILAIVAIVLIFLCNVAYSIVARRYNVLNSGRRGERQLYKAIKHLDGNNIVFCNLPVRYKRGRSELDMLIISHKGIIIVEVKNHSGTIQGTWKADKWEQKKYYKNGQHTVQEMDNPIKQMRRQRDIVKSILNAAGEEVWIDTVLYFSSCNAKLKLNLRENDYVCLGSKEILSFLNNYERGEVISKIQMEKYARILNEARANV
ncbi:MAG: NERD domain-containing protein [Oscillospiraceae bacterium]|nr:NERD domain-containing protein [Oscillospiraceae bacterium]